MVNSRSSATQPAANWVRRAAGAAERIEACFSGLAYAPHSHETYTLALTTDGVQSFHYRGALRRSLPGDVVVLHPDETHDGHAGSDRPFAYRAISIDPAAVQDVLGGACLPFLPDGVSNAPSLVRIACQLLAELQQPLAALEHQELIVSFATTLQTLSGRRVKHAAANYRAIKRVRDYIDEMMAVSGELLLHLDLDALATIAQYSKWQVVRDFRALYGTTPYRYITLKRLQKARKLIEQGRSLALVAASTGFADQSHLSRQFKSTFGTTPRVWATLQRRQTTASR